MATFEGRSVDYIKRNPFVHVKKSLRLSTSPAIQISVHTAPLNNVFQVIIRLPVPD